MFDFGPVRQRPLFATLVLLLTFSTPTWQADAPQLFGHAARAQQQGTVPGNTLGNSSDSQFWREIRRGMSGNVSIPDKSAGVLIQSEGENWRSFRNGPLSVWGAWALLGIVILLAVFFAVRGRIKVEAGASSRRIERFNATERFAHWLAAISFIVLALTGLNLLYGRYVLLPVIGPNAFSTLTLGGKYAHNYVAFAFMISVVFLFVLWVKENIPDRLDLQWLAKGGGMFKQGVHPPARKFNAGQKIIFWLVVLGGLSISLSGIALLLPFELHLFDWTFAVLNAVGFDLPRPLGALQEMQLSQLWHAIIGLALSVVIIAHIYIGTLGMVGAIDAMWSGEVDENWAREHHPLWVEELEAGAKETPPPGGARQPAPSAGE